MRYRKKPLVVEGFQYGIDNCPEWFLDKVLSDEIKIFADQCNINTLEGVMRAYKYDYIIKGVADEIYAIKKKIFLKSYDILDHNFDEAEPSKRSKRALTIIKRVKK